MNLKEHFGLQHGIGVLSTADAQGRVDAAVYSRPHVFEDGTVASVMRERLTHHNVSQNAYAAYLFIEEGSALGGVRLFLRKLREETDHDLIASMTRRHAAPATAADGAPYLSLVAFALAQNGAAVLFATPSESRKYRNLRANPRVSLLLATRGECDRDYESPEVITVVGRARVLRAGSAAWRETGLALRAKHPALASFLEARATALVRVEIEEAVHVGGFQRVTTWRPGP